MIAPSWARAVCVVLLVLSAIGRSSYGDEVKEGTVQVAGRITDENGGPLAGALVRVATPAADMRFAYLGSRHRVVERMTDAEGRYQLTVPLGDETTISVDAMKPGFGSAWGPVMSFPTQSAENVTPGTKLEVSMVLKAAQYAAGTVVDEQGKPVANVDVYAGLYHDQDDDWIGLTKTDERGRFEIFNFPLRPTEKHRAVLKFDHDRLVRAIVDDVYWLSPAEQRGMKVVMAAGRSLSGIVRDAAGAPVAKARVVVGYVDGRNDGRDGLTDNNGRFLLVGLAPRKAVVFAESHALKQQGHTSVALDRDQADVELRLQPIVLTEPLDTIDVLGLKLATITPELRAAYFLNDDARGVLVLDPGKNSARLGIGELQEGVCISRINDRRSSTVRRFVDLLLQTATTAKQEPPFPAKVHFRFSGPDGLVLTEATMELTPADVKELHAAAAALKARPVPPSVASQDDTARPMLGVVPNDDLRPGTPGAFISNIVSRSAAHEAGIRAGDVVTHIDETAVENGDHLIEIIRMKEPGDQIVVRIVRESPKKPRQELRLPVALGEY